MAWQAGDGVVRCGTDWRGAAANLRASQPAQTATMSTVTGARSVLLGITMLIVGVGCSMPQSQTESASAETRTTPSGRDVSRAAAATEQPLESLQVVTALREDVLTDLAIRLESQFRQDG